MNRKSAEPGWRFLPGSVAIIMFVLIAGAGCVNRSPESDASAQPTTFESTNAPILETQASPAAPVSTATAVETATQIPTAVPTQPERASAIPDPNTAVWREIASGLVKPLDMAAPMDGTGRLLIVEQIGKIVILTNGAILPEPFLDISDRIGTSGDEQGLLGLALHPDYVKNGYFFLNYTDHAGNTVISRFRRSDDPNRADPSSEYILLQVEQPYPNHNGGSVRFGPDGYLYLGLGDGGSQGDPHGNAQNPSSPLGKLLRIDVNRETGYGIPPGNLYQNGEGLPEVFASGLRNPWRIAFDPFNGDLYIADVGQNKWEEIDLLPEGSNTSRNFGWNFFEGRHEYHGPAPAGVDFAPPVWEYDHSQGCSITGGEVYDGQALPQWRGVYLFADFCTGRLWGFVQTSEGVKTGVLYETGAAVSSFGKDADGEVYLLDLKGRILRLEPAGG